MTVGVALLFAMAMQEFALPEPPPSMSTWAEIGDEFEATGMADCQFTADELSIGKMTLSRAVRWVGPGDIADVPIWPACAIVAIKVRPNGRVAEAVVRRFKGPGTASTARIMAGQSRFAPSDREWEGLFLINSKTSSRTETKAAAMKWHEQFKD